MLYDNRCPNCNRVVIKSHPEDEVTVRKTRIVNQCPYCKIRLKVEIQTQHLGTIRFYSEK